MLPEKFVLHALELFCNPLDLLPCGFALLGIQIRCFRSSQSPLRAVHNRRHHLQIADQFGGSSRRRLLASLGFEKQRGIIQDALADRRRSPSPSRIQLAGFAAIAGMLGEDRCHPLAVLQALPSHRHQKLHRHLRRDFPLPHLLLDGFRQ